MWIKFVGHPDGAELPLDGPLGGAEVYCPFDTPVNIPADLAKRLLEQPMNWQQAKSPKDEDEKPAKAGKE